MPPKRRSLTVRAPRGVDATAFLEAAYRMIDRAWVRVESKGSVLVAILRPRAGAPADLRGDMRLAMESARLLRRAGASRRTLRAAVLSRALGLADHVDARGNDDESRLSPERLQEIADLVAQGQALPRDPLGLRVPWRAVRHEENS
jgi:hypothetical protein